MIGSPLEAITAVSMLFRCLPSAARRERIGDVRSVWQEVSRGVVE